jgi:DNA-directed RNA polymerase specialized sigma24 family protein
MRGRAEDLAQETFLCLWEHLLKDKEVTHPFALLKRIGQRRIADEFGVRNRDTGSLSVDFSAPESVLIETSTGHRYASGEPELALVCDQLETAMGRMREASALWRDLHSKAATYRSRSEKYKDPDTCTKWRNEAVKAVGLRDEALVELQEACRVVGSLRAELERAGGCAWRSSSGWPPSAARDGRHRRCGALSDPTMKVCPNQHRLDDIESVGFLEDGTRTCRSCSVERVGAYRQRTAAKRTAGVAA